jgi:hypothetical protein
MIRIIDKERKAVSARVSLRVPFQQEIAADQYGRVLLKGTYGPDLEGTVIQERYLPANFRFPCSRGHSLEEHYLVLENAPR